MRKTYYIIVVEEDELAFERIVRALGKLGCEHDVRRVSTQADLDEELVRLAPDFVICDQSRAEWNSFAIMEQVRAFQDDMPFAMIGEMDKTAPATLLANGVDAWVDHDHLGDLAPTLLEMMKRHAEQQWQRVKAIRRNLRCLPRSRILQARTG